MDVQYPEPQYPPQDPPPAPLYNKFLERGREGKNDLWRYVIGLVITFGGYFLLSVPFLVVMTLAVARKGLTDPDEMRRMMTNPTYMGIDPNLFLFLLLLSFAGAMAGLLVAVKYVHRKPIISIITSAPRVRWSRIWIAGLAWFVLSGIWLGISYFIDPGNVRLTFDLKPFLLSLFIAVIFLPAQTWWEEFMMRGYLIQGLGLLTRTAWLPVLLTSVTFGLLHAGNPEVATHGFWVSMPLYILPGLLFGIIAVLDEGLEIPMGLHLANNLFGTLIITNDTSAIQASTIWRQNYTDTSLDMISMLMLPAFLLVFWFIYKWDFKKLYK